MMSVQTVATAVVPMVLVVCMHLHRAKLKYSLLFVGSLLRLPVKCFFVLLFVDRRQHAASGRGGGVLAGRHSSNCLTSLP